MFLIFCRFYTLAGHHNSFNRSVFIVIQVVDTNRSSETSVIGWYGTIVLNKIRLAFKFNYRLVIGIAVASNFI